MEPSVRRIRLCEDHSYVVPESQAKDAAGRPIPQPPCHQSPTHVCRDCGALLCAQHADGHHHHPIADADADGADALDRSTQTDPEEEPDEDAEVSIQ